MTMADVSVLVLVALFAATLLPRFNLGLAALPAAFLVGLASGRTAEEVTAFFPGDFFVLVVGVTALFATAQVSGTLDWLLERVLALVGRRAVLVPLVPFVVGAVLTAVGTLPAAATAIVAPIALGLAARQGIAPLVGAVLGVTGIISGLLSPLAVYGVSARNLGSDLGLDLPDSAPALLLAGGILTGLLVCVGLLTVGVRTGAVPTRRLLPAGVGRSAGASDDDAAPAAPVPASPLARPLTLTALLVVVVLSVGFDLNIGYLGLCAAVLLQLALRLDAGTIVARLPWNVVLLIGGLLTYVGLMQDLGAFERISDLLSVEGSAFLSLLVLCYIAGITSFAASSIAVFLTTMPLVPAVVAAGGSPVGAVLAVAMASVLVDVNPLGITGGLILGAAEPEVRPRLFRQLLAYGLVSVVVAPALACLLFFWW